MQRRAVIAVALTFGAVSAPAALHAQVRGMGPNPDTPRLLVAVFQSSDRMSGVQAAEAIRSRVQSASNVKQLYVIPWNDIKTYLESSGYKSDSSLGPTDLKELAKLLRADEVLAGTVTKSPTGSVKIEPRLMLARDPALAQPLATAEGSAGDAARQIERSLQEARKQLQDNKACENAIRDSKNDAAITFAKAGITKYPNATIARLCYANAFVAMKAPPDSVLRVANEIIRIDPKNSRALGYVVEAAKAKGDNEGAVRALVKLVELEPSNTALMDQVITTLAQLGKPDVAIPIIRELLAQNPGDPRLLKNVWLLTLADAATATDTAMRAQKFGTAVAAGEDMIKADSTLADSTFFERQIVAGNAMVPPRGGEIAAKAVQKFPNSSGFWASKANAERKAGQSQMAIESMKRALSLNAKIPNGNLLLAQIYVDLNQADSAVDVAHRAITGGEDSKTWGAFLLGPTQAAWKKADASKDSTDYKRTLALAEESDKLSSSAPAAFFAGVSSFYLGIGALQAAQKPKSCSLAKTAQDMFVKTQMFMPRGGQIDKGTAQTVMGYVMQYSPTADQMVKQYCK